MKKVLFTCIIIFRILVSVAQWNPNPAINLQISSLLTADMQSVSTTDGKLWVAFYHENGNNYDMRAQLFDAAGNKLLGPDGVLVSNKTTGTATFVFNVCVDGSNNLIIGCQDERSGPNVAVLYKISQGGIHLWGSDGIVLGEGLAPYPAVLSNGEVVVAWNESIDNTLKMQKVATNGTLAWAAPVSILVGTDKTSRGQIVANLNNKFTVVFQKRGYGPYTTLYAQGFDNTGTALYSPLQICDQTTASYNYYSIKVDADTTYYGYYCSSGNRFNSFLQRINPDGSIPWGMNGSIFNTSTSPTDNYQGPTSICHTAGSPYVWAVCTFSDVNQDNYGVYVQKFLKSSGARLLSDLAKEIYPVGANLDKQYGELVLTGDAPMFITEDIDYKIYATRLDANGNFVWPGNRIILSSTIATLSNPKMREGFAYVGSDNYAAIWTEDRGGGYLGYIQDISINGALNLENVNLKEMKVYPNPVKNYLNVGNLKGSDLYIYNSLGLICFVVEKLNEDVINLSALDNGIYVLVSNNINQTSATKIVISR